MAAFGMDHGKPVLPGSNVWFCSDEHTTFAPPRRVGDRVLLTPGHVDRTMALHQQLYLYAGEDLVDTWPIDLRWW